MSLSVPDIVNVITIFVYTTESYQGVPAQLRQQAKNKMVLVKIVLLNT